MARRLAQAQQRFEDLDLRLVDADAIDLRQQRLAVMLAQFVVELALRVVELAVDRLLEFLRQVRRDLLLGAAEDERPQRAGEKRARLRRSGSLPANDRKTETAPSMPGLRNSNRLHSSPR